MSREEAFALLRAGKKVSHEYFTDVEYLEMKGNSIMTEDGYIFDREFHKTPWMAAGWRECVEPAV